MWIEILLAIPTVTVFALVGKVVATLLQAPAPDRWRPARRPAGEPEPAAVRGPEPEPVRDPDPVRTGMERPACVRACRAVGEG